MEALQFIGSGLRVENQSEPTADSLPVRKLDFYPCELSGDIFPAGIVKVPSGFFLLLHCVFGWNYPGTFFQVINLANILLLADDIYMDLILATQSCKHCLLRKDSAGGLSGTNVRALR